MNSTSNPLNPCTFYYSNSACPDLSLTNGHLSTNSTYYPAITFPTGGINYMACNIGSVYFNIRNGNEVYNLDYGKMNTINITYLGTYASVPACVPGWSAAPIDSNGKCISALGSSWGAFYPAIIFPTGGINYTSCNSARQNSAGNKFERNYDSGGAGWYHTWVSETNYSTHAVPLYWSSLPSVGNTFSIGWGTFYPAIY